jgi:hypothetical protein
MKYQHFFFLLLFLSAVCCGCGQRTLQVSGTVTYKGTPIEKGGIVFVPVDKPELEFKNKIINGTYTVEIPIKEIGKMSVRIFAVREDEVKNPSQDWVLTHPNEKQVETVQYLPNRYNTDSILTADITTTSDVTFDFPIEP